MRPKYLCTFSKDKDDEESGVSLDFCKESMTNCSDPPRPQVSRGVETQEEVYKDYTKGCLCLICKVGGPGTQRVVGSGDLVRGFRGNQTKK